MTELYNQDAEMNEINLFGPIDVTSDDGVVSANFDEVSEAVFNLLTELDGFKIWEYPETAKFVLDIIKNPRRWVLSLPNGEMNIVFVDTNKTFKLGESNESARFLYFLNVAFKEVDSTLAGIIAYSEMAQSALNLS